MDETVARYDAAVGAFDTRVREVPTGRWTAATPCTEWDVRTLVNHLVGEQRWVSPLLEGRTIAEVGHALDGDLLGDDPVAAWTAASAEAVASFAAPGATARTVHLSYGDDSAAGYCEQLTFDHLIHAWDLARGAGIDDRLPDGLVAWALEWVEPMRDAYASSGMFAPPLDVPAAAPAQTRLLAITGRAA
jgi:uncharacterized protein (TIGR03086 family)